MKRVLVVSPHFPPVNAPDMHRVRISLPYLEEFGWTPHVLAVDAAHQEDPSDETLAHSIPAGTRVTRVRALPAAITRKIGIGNVALRALPFLYAAGARILASERHALAYFSTTMFPSMALGRAWKRRFGVPYVVDMQDPWLTTYYDEHPGARRPPKYRLAHRLDAVLEPWTMRKVDGIIAVSDAYVDTLRSRYAAIDADCCITLPFGGAERDFETLSSLPLENRVFRAGDGLIHGVYVGRGGDDLATALRILFGALSRPEMQASPAFARMQLHFVGTDYAPADRARKTVQPLAEQAGVGQIVTEQTGRVAYFEALRVLRDADFLVVVGSDDPQYTASKIYPYVLAKRPILAVLHEQSSGAQILRSLGTGPVVTFSSEGDGESAAAALAPLWRCVLDRLPFEPDTDWTHFAPYTAREMTRRQCALFDKVLSRRAN